MFDVACLGDLRPVCPVTVPRSAGSSDPLLRGRWAAVAGYGSAVRWEQLFADLEAQLSAARADEARAELSELVRAERATVRLVDRLRGTCGRPVRVHVGDLPGELGAVVAGDLVEVGAGWLLVLEQAARQALVPFAAVQALEGVAAHSAPAVGEVERRLGLGTVLRALARDRAEVQVQTSGRTVVGRIDRVGADHLDVLPGRDAPVSTVPLAAVRVVRSR